MNHEFQMWKEVNLIDQLFEPEVESDVNRPDQIPGHDPNAGQAQMNQFYTPMNNYQQQPYDQFGYSNQPNRDYSNAFPSENSLLNDPHQQPVLTFNYNDPRVVEENKGEEVMHLSQYDFYHVELKGMCTDADQ